jgi:hypothetical protein
MRATGPCFAASSLSRSASRRPQIASFRRWSWRHPLTTDLCDSLAWLQDSRPCAFRSRDTRVWLGTGKGALGGCARHSIVCRSSNLSAASLWAEPSVRAVRRRRAVHRGHGGQRRPPATRYRHGARQARCACDLGRGCLPEGIHDPAPATPRQPRPTSTYPQGIDPEEIIMAVRARRARPPRAHDVRQAGLQS